MEEEERAAQSAKLQELIRRGGPEDLQEANKLMKVMAGYDTRHKTDYRAKAAEEVGKIQQKAKLLEERLQNFKSGDKLQEGDVFEVLDSTVVRFIPRLTMNRIWRIHCRALNQRFRKCARRSPTTRKLWQNYLRLMIVYIVRLSGISSSNRVMSRAHRKSPKGL